MKKMLRTLLGAAVLALLAAGSALAAQPLPGTYHSTDLGGAVLLGRGTQSWDAPLNASQGLLDVFNSMSWNGAVLGTQWTFSCGVQNGAQTVQDNRVAGTGSVVFTNIFNGGVFWLSKNGPWGDGVNDLTGTVDVTQSIVTLIYVNGVPVQARLNIDSSGMFEGGVCALRFVVANGIGGGDTDLLPKPPGYPDFQDTNCNPSRVFGSWGDISQVSMLIDCPVPVRQSTWGVIKTLYR
jgi:hypothetical protein